MGGRRVRALIGLLVAVLVPAGAVPAMGAPPWSGPTMLGLGLDPVSVAALPGGRALLAYGNELEPDSGFAEGVHLATLGAGGVGERLLLDPLGHRPKVASGPAGVGVVVWERADGLYAVHRRPDGTLTPPRHVLSVSDTQEIRSFDAAMAGRDLIGARTLVVAIVDALPAYGVGQPTGSVMSVESFGPGFWDPPSQIAGELTRPVMVDLATTSAGGAVAAWGTRPLGGRGRVVAARKKSNGPWEDIRAVATRSAVDIAVAVAETGAPAVGWIQSGPRVRRVLARSRGPLGAWGPAVELAATGAIDHLSLGSDAAGGMTMTWERDTGRERRLQIATRTPGGAWSLVGSLAALTSRSFRPHGIALDVNHRGDAVVAWTAEGPGYLARYRRGGAGFGPLERTAPTGSGFNVQGPATAIDHTGAASIGLRLGRSGLLSELAGALRATPPAPAVSDLRLSTARLGPDGTLRVRFRLDRPGRVVLAVRPAPGSAARLVRFIDGRRGLNVVTLGARRDRIPVGYPTVSIGLTGHETDPGVLSARIQRLRRPIP